MKEPVTIYAAKTRLSELVTKAEAGEEIIIARGKKPVARLVPIDTEPIPAPQRHQAKPRHERFGRLRGELNVSDDDLFAPLPADELDRWHK